MVEKKYYDWGSVREWVNRISFQMYKDEWRPDYIVGLTRGGLIPSVIMSNALDIPMHTLSVSLRDNPDTESNLWMSEDAFGYSNKEFDTINGELVTSFSEGKKILIVDDINDTGATLNWIVDDWTRNCLPNDCHWESVWGNNVRFAVLVDNLSSKFYHKINYCGMEINKAEKDVWIVFPWEKT